VDRTARVVEIDDAGQESRFPSGCQDDVVRVAIASIDPMPQTFTDDQVLVAALAERGVEAEIEPWDRAGVDWHGFDMVVLRSPWDYSRRRDEFLAWCESVGPRLHNPVEVVRWNSDKRYLGDLASDGRAVVETTYVAPADPLPAVEGEVVVKPTISAGARDTGRFGADRSDDALALIAAIQAQGKTAMVQPFQASVDVRGETACVFFAGEFSHSLRKRAVLRPDEIAPLRDDAIGAAEVMYSPDLVGPGDADEDELTLARDVLAAVKARFGTDLLYARVDMLRDDAGAPVLLELEAVEPNLYFDQVPAAAARLADAIVATGE
jgi:hypothetical protein